MKLSDSEQKEYSSGPSVMANQPLYPWGLQLTLDDEALKKLGLKELPKLDQVMVIHCKAQVTGLHSRKESNDEDDSCINLQITDMELIDKGEDSRASKLYTSKE